jgi:hypothetical protein
MITIQELIASYPIPANEPIILVLWSAITLWLIISFKQSSTLNFLTWLVPCGTLIAIVPEYQDLIIIAFKLLTSLYLAILVISVLRRVSSLFIKVGFQIFCVNLLCNFFCATSLQTWLEEVKFPDLSIDSVQKDISQIKNNIIKEITNFYEK